VIDVKVGDRDVGCLGLGDLELRGAVQHPRTTIKQQAHGTSLEPMRRCGALSRWSDGPRSENREVHISIQRP
jgi:hypothetical protein